MKCACCVKRGMKRKVVTNTTVWKFDGASVKEGSFGVYYPEIQVHVVFCFVKGKVDGNKKNSRS